MKRFAVVAALAVTSLCGLASLAISDPLDEKLVIDDVDITTSAKAPKGLPFDEIHSGWLYRSAETRAFEADPFQNPGMLYVERGKAIWESVDGSKGKSCASCHGDAAQSMKGVGAQYPKWDKDAKRPKNVELQINNCRKSGMDAEPYKFDADDQKALATYIRHQSLGAPVKLDLSVGELQSWWDKGKSLYYTRTGQLNFSCASCHERAEGHQLRADHVSQGQVNGFPTYRFEQAAMVSTHGRFRGCIRDTRAEMPPGFSDELMALELYVTSRGEGLSVESPAVRQ